MFNTLIQDVGFAFRKFELSRQQPDFGQKRNGYHRHRRRQCTDDDIAGRHATRIASIERSRTTPRLLCATRHRRRCVVGDGGSCRSQRRRRRANAIAVHSCLPQCRSAMTQKKASIDIDLIRTDISNNTTHGPARFNCGFERTIVRLLAGASSAGIDCVETNGAGGGDDVDAHAGG